MNYTHFQYTKYSCDELGTVYGPRNKPIGSKNQVHGYNTVSVHQNGKVKQYRKHRFIVECYIGSQIPEGMVINHINGIKTDNRLSNLEIVTHQQNTQHAVDLGLMKPKSGELNGNCKITEETARAIIRSILANKTNLEISSEFNLSSKHISSIRRKHRWAHLYEEEEFIDYSPSRSVKVSDLNKKLIVIHFALNTSLSNRYIAKLFNTDNSSISRIRSGKLYQSIMKIYEQESSTTIENLMSQSELVEYRQATGSGSTPIAAYDIV